MKKYYLYSIMIALVLLSFTNLSAQIAAKIYEDPNLEAIVNTHRTIAILPMDVSVRDVKASKKNRMTPEEMAEMEDAYQEAFQNSMYSWFLRMKDKGKFDKEIQDVHKTNAILKSNGIETVDDLGKYSHEQLAEMLEVDGLFGGNVVTTRTMSQGGALAIAVIVGVGVKTGDADVFVKLYDKSGKLIWSFDRTVASSYANTPEDVVDYLMKRVSKRFPYRVRK